MVKLSPIYPEPKKPIAMLSTIEKALFLKKINLFESMSPEHLKILSNISEEITFQEGDILFNEGDAADNLYVIVDGEIEILKNHGTPQQVLLAQLSIKDSFGEMAMFGSEGRSAAAVASKDSTFLAMQKEHLLLPRPGKSDDLHHHRFSARNIIRENNKQQSILDNEQQGSGKNQGSKDKRRHDRFSIPGVVDIPAFSGNPVELKNISTGGLLLSLADEPDSEGDFEVTLTIKGKDYRWKNVTVAWTNKDEEHLPWTAGLKVEMTDEERDHFKDMLEEMDP
jgi:hypothetical protein